MDVKTIKQEQPPFMESFITELIMINERLNSLQQRNFHLNRKCGVYPSSEPVVNNSRDQSEQDESNIKGCLINELNQAKEYLTELEERVTELETFI